MRLGRVIGFDEIFGILETKGSARYGGEDVSQLQHALQCAALAERARASDHQVTAALFHDIGHLIVDDEGAALNGIDLEHEASGADALEALFGPDVAEPVRLHVQAKRYLCATNARHMSRLSEASTLSLKIQGGPMSAGEAEHFAAQPHGRAAIALRSWDDAAKDPNAQTPTLDHYRARARRILLQS